MRRSYLIGLLTATLLTLSLGAAAPAGTAPAAASRAGLSGPIPQQYPPSDDPAGDPCPFPLHTTFPVNHVVGYTYTDAAGRVETEFFSGALIARVTNVDTGKTVRLNLSGDGVQRFAKDGSSTLYGIGPYSSRQHPGDHPGPELALISGASALRFGADGHKTIRYASHVRNVCDQLS